MEGAQQGDMISDGQIQMQHTPETEGMMGRREELAKMLMAPEGEDGK